MKQPRLLPIRWYAPGSEPRSSRVSASFPPGPPATGDRLEGGGVPLGFRVAAGAAVVLIIVLAGIALRADRGGDAATVSATPEHSTRTTVATPTTPASPAPLVATTPAPPAPYYENCDAARSAGAAPVHRGEPGYGPHLDRDADGTGCE